MRSKQKKEMRTERCGTWGVRGEVGSGGTWRKRGNYAFWLRLPKRERQDSCISTLANAEWKSYRVEKGLTPGNFVSLDFFQNAELLSYYQIIIR